MNDEEDVTARLLRLAGAPPDPPVEREARVREAVHHAWRAHRRQRVMRRTAAAIVVSGVAAAVIIGVRMDRAQRTTVPTPLTVLATGARIQGRPAVRRGDHDTVPLTAAMPIRAGDVIETDNASRASLQTADGSSLRIDRASRVRFVARTAIDLMSGAAYIETAAGSHGFEVRTPWGSVQDVGTRFEVRLSDASLRLRVRTGIVQIRRGATVTGAAAGTETTVTTSGIAVRQVPSYGAEWAWTATLAPPFTIEGHSLRAFLEHTAAEEGWTLRYATADVAAAADRTILHGSVEGLRAEDALDVALATSGLTYRLEGGELLVSKPQATGNTG